MSAIRVFVGEKNAHKRTTLRTGIEFDLLAESHEPLNPIVKLGNSDCEIPAPNKKPIAWWEGRKDWSFEADCHVLIKCIWYIYIYYIYYIWLLRILIASRGKQKGKYIIHLILWAIESGRFQVLPLFSWKLSVLPLKNGWLEDYFSWGHLLFFFWRCHYPILSPCMEYFSTFSWFFNGKCR